MPNDDYILRRDALNEFHEWIVSNDGNIFSLADALETIPAADVEPKRETGWWIPGDHYEYDDHGETVRHPGGVTCSRCRYSFNARHLWSREYCPHCGAKMLSKPPKEGDGN